MRAARLLAMLLDVITEQIRTHGPLTVHDYMSLCLQHPDYGYYRKAQAVGAEGDFTTAPEVSQIFGDLLGLWIIHAWQMLGSPPKALLAELGPGRGTLAADLMRILKKNPVTQEVFSLHLVESNETLREQQAQKLWQYQPEWYGEVAGIPTDMPLFVVANEFFDALPIRQFVGSEERRVELDDGQLCFAPEGIVTHEDCPAGEAILQQLCERLKSQGGCALIIDYGYGKDAGHGDTLQAVKDHRYHHVLKDPGEVDLTAHVDFGKLSDIARDAGMTVHPLAQQGPFLQRIGGDFWLQKLLAKAATPEQQKELEIGWLRLISPAAMGEIFKVMAITPTPCVLAGLR